MKALLRLSDETLNSVLPCPRCKAFSWKIVGEAANCGSCGLRAGLKGGVLCLPVRASSTSTRFFNYTKGPRFLGIKFTENMLLYSTTRLYLHYLKEWFPKPSGYFLDVGSGDGRIALWALKYGFSAVVAVDSSLPALQRLVAAASDSRARSKLVAICCPLSHFPLVRGRFSAVVCCEVLYYLGTHHKQDQFLRKLGNALASSGRLVLAEPAFFGGLLNDIVALNVKNIQIAAQKHSRIEKFGPVAVEVKYPTLSQLKKRCTNAGLTMVDIRGVSPISMLLQYAYTFTSYPLRPRLDKKFQAEIDELENLCSEASDLSRNLVLLLKKRSAKESSTPS